MTRRRRQLTAAEKRALASAGLTVVRYRPDGERAQIRQLAPEGPGRHRDFIRRLTSTDEINEASEGSK